MTLSCQKLITILEEGNLNAVKKIVSDASSREIADCLRVVNPAQKVLVFRLLEKNQALIVFEFLDRSEQSQLVRAMEEPDLIQLFEKLNTEERVRLFGEMPAKVVKRVLKELHPEARQKASMLLGYPEESAGRVMNPDYLALPKETSVAETLEMVRQSSLPPENLEVVFVIDPGRHYKGYVPLSYLLISAPDMPIKNLVIKGASVTAYDSQDKVAEIFKRHQYPLIAVVDKEERLVGAIDAERGLELVELYEAQRLTTFGGIIQTTGGPDVDIIRSPLKFVFKARVIWLILLTFFGILTSNFVAEQEEILSKVIILAAFIPPIVDMGGNTGSQSATLVIRSMALGDVRPRFGDFFRVFRREIPVALALGITIGICETVLAYLSKGVGYDVLAVVGLSMITVTILGGIIGTGLPFVAKRFGTDPATLSSPLITSIMDLLGFFIYFGYAYIFMGHLLN